MEEFNGTKQRTHKLTLNNRRSCTVTGVADVSEIMLETDQGMLMIKGSELHVNRLTLEKGEVDVDGKIDSLTYSEAGSGYGNKNESFLSKLFK